jgi:PilZ domain-containing protein
MGSERRSVSRKRPSELSYIQFGEEIGGIVWNASEQGLGFQAVAPVQKSGPLRLCISPNPKNRIELLGTIVWTDESERSGGLQFTELCPETRDLVRGWLTEPPVSETTDQGLILPSLGTDEATGLSSGTENQTTDALSIGGVSRDVLAAGVSGGASTLPTLDAFQRRASLPKLASQAQHLSGSGSRWMHALSTALVICALVLAPILLLGNFRSDIGRLLIRLGERLKADNNVRTVPYPSSPARGSRQDPSQAQLNGGTSSAETQERPVSPGPLQNIAGASTAPASVSSEPGLMTEQLTNLHSARRGSALARELWSEIGAGNVAAEVELAELYMSGNGVRRNCEQARVLLRAAARGGNIEAAQRLRNLKTAGCR